MKTVFILLDSLNRHMLAAYGNEWVQTPAIDRLAARGVVYNNHFCGSMPCIPARRDFLTGKACFLEAPWGPLEPWDKVLPNILREQRGTYSHIITDHPHYFNGGAGDRYHNCFDSWEYERGQVWDPWHGVVDVREPVEGARIYGYSVYRHQHYANLMFRDSERDKDYPSVRSVERAIEFVTQNCEADNWHLQLELFDPHEPFDCPRSYLDKYGDAWTGPPYTDPGYRSIDPSVDNDESVRHVRNAYAATLTMVDTWLGKLLDTMDALEMWDDTAVVLTTDHGLLLGEHDLFGKNFSTVYPELCRIPLIVCHPDVDGGTRDHVTGAVDIMPTFLDIHGAECPDGLHGRSLLPSLLEDTTIHEEGLLFGYFGQSMNFTDGRCIYTRYPLPDSVTHMHFSSALYRDQGSFPNGNVKALQNADHGLFLDSAEGIPHYRSNQEWIRKPDHGYNPIFDLAVDPGGLKPINDKTLETEYAEKLLKILNQYGAPECHAIRLGYRQQKETT